MASGKQRWGVVRRSVEVWGLAHGRWTVIKRVFLDIVLGVLLFVLVLIVEFVVTLPFGGPPPESGDLRGFLNHEFLLTAAPVLLLAGLLGLVVHTRSIREGLRRGLIWMAVIAAIYLVIGLGNATTVMFATPGMWLTLAAVAAGAVAAGWLDERGAGRTHHFRPAAD